jgi:hypothetical protein
VHLGLLNFHCFFVTFYKSRLTQLYVLFNNPRGSGVQEPKEEDYDYMEELGDDHATGATSHPTSLNPTRHA